MTDMPCDSAAGGPVAISVFLPCYNEQANVARTVGRVEEVLEGIRADYEIIIVDDGSTDDTARIAEELIRGNPRVRIVRHPSNRGYGAALISGFRAATRPLVFYTDGDGQFDFGEMPALLPLMQEYDIVSCYRIDRKDNIIRRINGWAWTQLVCRLFALRVRDIDCAFKLYKRSIFDDMVMASSGALIDTEILARAVRKGYRITQRGVHHYPRTAGAATGASPRVIIRAFRELFQLYGRIRSQD